MKKLREVIRCAYCKSTWLSGILISILVLTCNEWFVLTYPFTHIFLYHLLDTQPDTPDPITEAKTIHRRYHEEPIDG